MDTNYIQAVIDRNRAQAEDNRKMLRSLKFNLALFQSKLNSLNTDISNTEKNLMALTGDIVSHATIKPIQPAEMHLVAS